MVLKSSFNVVCTIGGYQQVEQANTANSKKTYVHMPNAKSREGLIKAITGCRDMRLHLNTSLYRACLGSDNWSEGDWRRQHLITDMCQAAAAFQSVIFWPVAAALDCDN